MRLLCILFFLFGIVARANSCGELLASAALIRGTPEERASALANHVRLLVQTTADLAERRAEPWGVGTPNWVPPNYMLPLLEHATNLRAEHGDSVFELLLDIAMRQDDAFSTRRAALWLLSKLPSLSRMVANRLIVLIEEIRFRTMYEEFVRARTPYEDPRPRSTARNAPYGPSFALYFTALDALAAVNPVISIQMSRRMASAALRMQLPIRRRGNPHIEARYRDLRQAFFADLLSRLISWEAEDLAIVIVHRLKGVGDPLWVPAAQVLGRAVSQQEEPDWEPYLTLRATAEFILQRGIHRSFQGAWLPVPNSEVLEYADVLSGLRRMEGPRQRSEQLSSIVLALKAVSAPTAYLPLYRWHYEQVRAIGIALAQTDDIPLSLDEESALLEVVHLFRDHALEVSRVPLDAPADDEADRLRVLEAQSAVFEVLANAPLRVPARFLEAIDGLMHLPRMNSGTPRPRSFGLFEAQIAWQALERGDPKP